MVGVRVGWGGPLSNPLECGFWQLGFLHCLKPQASLGGAALCWVRLCYELVLLKSLHLPWKSLQRWGREEQDLFLLILQSTQPRYADDPGLQACLISQGGCLSVRGEVGGSSSMQSLSRPHAPPWLRWQQRRPSRGSD